jgi:hypothetical protein
MEVSDQQIYQYARCIFMDLQLELLPYHYYNTLGFDVELIERWRTSPRRSKSLLSDALPLLYTSRDLLFSRAGEAIKRTKKARPGAISSAFLLSKMYQFTAVLAIFALKSAPSCFMPFFSTSLRKP